MAQCHEASNGSCVVTAVPAPARRGTERAERLQGRTDARKHKQPDAALPEGHAAEAKVAQRLEQPRRKVLLLGLRAGPQRRALLARRGRGQHRAPALPPHCHAAPAPRHSAYAAARTLCGGWPCCGSVIAERPGRRCTLCTRTRSTLRQPQGALMCQWGPCAARAHMVRKHGLPLCSAALQSLPSRARRNQTSMRCSQQSATSCSAITSSSTPTQSTAVAATQMLDLNRKTQLGQITCQRPSPAQTRKGRLAFAYACKRRVSEASQTPLLVPAAVHWQLEFASALGGLHMDAFAQVAQLSTSRPEHHP